MNGLTLVALLAMFFIYLMMEESKPSTKKTRRRNRTVSYQSSFAFPAPRRQKSTQRYRAKGIDYVAVCEIAVGYILSTFLIVWPIAIRVCVFATKALIRACKYSFAYLLQLKRSYEYDKYIEEEIIIRPLKFND